MAAPTLPADKFDPNLTFVRPETPPSRVPLDKLAVLPGFNTRVKDAEYGERVTVLTESIKLHGFYEDKPFSVTMLPDDETVYIFDGEHRFDAARAASLDGIEFPDGLPVAFAKDGATVRDLTVHLVHGNAGANLNPVEMAAVVRRLQALGLNKEEIATEIGKTTRHVDNLLVLAGSNATVKKAVAAGQIAAAEAVKLVRKDPKTAAAKITEAVKAAEERGKAKATPKTMREATGPKMKTIKIDVSLATGDKMGEVLKSVAKSIRAEVKVGDDDALVEDGKLVVAVTVIDHDAEAEAARKAEEKAAAAAERERVAAEKKAEREAAAKAKAEAKKAADAEKAAKKKAADKAKADAAKAAAKAKADKAKAADKAAGAKTTRAQTVEKPSKANGGTGGAPRKTAAQAKADAQAHLGTTEGKTAPAVVTPGAAESAVGADSVVPATGVAPEGGIAPDGPAAGQDDGNNGL